MNHPTQETYVASMAELLTLEARAIEQAARQLRPEQAERAINLLAECTGKVVVTGVGKSGFIARKIAATLTSTGTRAVFLHPSDALHGDLGIIATGDVVVLISNSGETDEVVAMVPYLHHRGVPLIAIVGNERSTLALESDA